jgi:predicted negative regulator of RcsB-dependent stress response
VAESVVLQRAEALCQQGLLQDARALLEQALANDPLNWQVVNLLGLVMFDLHDYNAAKRWSSRAVALNPQCLTALNNLGSVAMLRGDKQHARDCFERALQIDAQFAPAANNLASLLFMSGDARGALPHLRVAAKAFRQSQAIKYNLALALLYLGDYAEGLRYYEARFSAWGLDAPRDPRDLRVALVPPSQCLPIQWQGKRILLISDQGIGDDLCFLRFAPRLRAKGAWLAYAAPERLHPLLERENVVDSLLKQQPIPEVDYVFPVSDLAYLAGCFSVKDVPAPVDLSCRVLSGQTSIPEDRPRPYIGVSWSAGSHHKGSQSKQIPLEQLLDVLAPLGGTLVILQRDPVKEDLAAVYDRCTHVWDASMLNADLVSMLCCLRELDEYVGVSNTNFHLCASIGRTSRVLSKFPPDFRWIPSLDGSTPWFPGATVYQQSPDGSWQDALSKLALELGQKATS